MIREAALQWEGKVAECLHLMFAAMQVSAGQPARVTELVTVLYANSGTNVRSLFFYRGLRF